MSVYLEKLKDPRWQKKRLKILERDGWKCTQCDDSTSSLQIHHRAYWKEPWDAPDFALWTLCEPCHKSEKGFKLYCDKLSVIFRSLFSGEDCQNLINLIEYVGQNGVYLGDIADAVYVAIEGLAVGVDWERCNEHGRSSGPTVPGVSEEAGEGKGEGVDQESAIESFIQHADGGSQ